MIDPNEARSAGYANGCADEREDVAEEIAQLKADLRIAQSETAASRRAYLYEKDRADNAVSNA